MPIPWPSERVFATCAGSSRTPHSHTNAAFSPGHQDASLAGPHEELGTVPPSRRPFVPCGCLPCLLGQALQRASPTPKGANPPAEQAELAVRMHQIRVAEAEARTAAAISSEGIAHENLRQIQDRRMQEWTSSGTPVPAIGETQVLIGTPVIGWGGPFGSPQAPPEGAERSAAAAEEGAVEQPRENGILEDDEEELLIPLEVHSAPEYGLPPRVACLRDAPRNEAVPTPGLGLCPPICCTLYTRPCSACFGCTLPSVVPLA
jgi:hypothetical protein